MNNAAIIASSERAEWPQVRVNGIELDPEAIAREMQYHPAENREDAIYLAAQALVIRELLDQRAAELGVEVRPAAGETAEEALIRGLLECEVQVPEADEASLQRFYQANQARYCSAPLVAASHILLAVPAEDAVGRSQQREVALQLISQLQEAPERFAELTKRHSDCPSKEQGGALGQISQGQTVPEFERQLLRLPEGLSAQPLESRYGLHIVRVDQRIDGRQLPYEHVRDSIARELGERVWRKAVVQYLETLMAEAEIEGIVLRAADSPLVQ
ncbi:peptidylprolyl isomerase [Halopseudomonas phragmitis]|uniref:peptidylprolyl isomerase n=1 Tax=Halopseudomonas phragmitis TaxID=1931241 RepID=A0A1V0B8M1_9GAMM|nr:peptidylprolyl isomerase [Halopseudomonas phragmitis]AQZ96257.1 peptidylprolyl isomerase [Halopseudomonas phragmitis]